MVTKDFKPIHIIALAALATVAFLGMSIALVAEIYIKSGCQGL